uniref:Uncharacterized protein n=1 Tax=Siphoviridae sp. ctoRD1 TaxID=2825669 RepID=A0A8S5QEJ5_9CAUD|nr:MAG TPA: hypothetical protein [Siphoviridae sp. ctoRD1]
MDCNKSKSFQGPCIFSIVLSSKSNQYTVGNCQ